MYYSVALPDGTLVESLPRTATDKKGRTKLIGGTTYVCSLFTNNNYLFTNNICLHYFVYYTNNYNNYRLWDFIEDRDDQQWVAVEENWDESDNDV